MRFNVVGGSPADHDLGSRCRSMFRFAKEVAVESVGTTRVLNRGLSVQPYNVSDLGRSRAQKLISPHWETLLFVFSKSGISHAVISATPENTMFPCTVDHAHLSVCGKLHSELQRCSAFRYEQ
jgi:hypothetical protein